MSTLDERLAEHERRDARDAWRAAGGSQRRPMRSFMTDAEKRERRQEHAERIRAALSAVETTDGFAAWLEARELNPRLTPLSWALVALQCPGEIIDTAKGWNRQGCRVRKGEAAACFITAPGFWPRAAFSAAQTDAPPELLDFEPPQLPAVEVGELVERFERDGRKTATLNAYAESLTEVQPGAEV